MNEISRRIADLTPEKRKLLEQLIEKQALSSSAQAPSSDEQASTALASEGDLDLASGQLTLGPISSPHEAKGSWIRFYDEVSRQLDSAEFGSSSFFLNYGYVPERNPQYAKVELPLHFLNKNSVRLVLEVVGDCNITDCRVLDVGCGRGGTVYTINHFFDAKTITGVDLSPNAISFCKKAHRHPRVNFFVGDAEQLPFEDESFEVVTNLESSHSYPNIEAFYSGVFRMLTPGGHFLYTDVLAVERWVDCMAFLKELGFTVERDLDITTNVLLSCDEIAGTRVQAFDQNNSSDLMNDFLSVPGSRVYDEMSSQRWSYRLLKLKKAGDPVN